MAWYAIYTKSRMEKKVSLRLEELGIEAYCPTTKRKKQWSDRKKWLEEVLFRSYVFVNIDLEKQSGLVRRTFGVVNFVYWLHKPAVIQDDEIHAIKCTIESVSVAHIPNKEAHPWVSLKHFCHLPLLHLVSGINNNSPRIEFLECHWHESMAERTSATGYQYTFVL